MYLQLGREGGRGSYCIGMVESKWASGVWDVPSFGGQWEVPK